MLESVLGLLLTSHACQHVRAARRRVAVVQKQLQSPRVVFVEKSLIFCYDLCTKLGECSLITVNFIVETDNIMISALIIREG